MIASLATLVLGILIGYMGQRSKFCTISGIRDFFMLKDSFRFKGLLGLIAGSAVGFIAFKLIGETSPTSRWDWVWDHRVCLLSA